MKRILLVFLIAAITGCATTAAPPEDRHPDDPWEPFNRTMHSFNMAADRAVLRPVARGYDKVTPEPVQGGVRNFFRNLRSPVIMMNLLLQGRGSELEDEFQRFIINTVYGIGGVFDVASAGGMEKHHGDFGQTLATWGWEDSRFVMLPLLGPSTVRDTVGRGVDIVPNVAWRLALQEGTFGLVILDVVQMRADMLPLDAELEAAFDDYILMRDGWSQRRQFMIFGEEAGAPDYDAWLDDDEWENDDW
ncbi:MAG: VacJ family lipoprotein [Wenzhouxiangella sp.]